MQTLAKYFHGEAPFLTGQQPLGKGTHMHRKAVHESHIAGMNSISLECKFYNKKTNSDSDDDDFQYVYFYR
jgi:hypothetical protein